MWLKKGLKIPQINGLASSIPASGTIQDKAFSILVLRAFFFKSDKPPQKPLHCLNNYKLFESELLSNADEVEKSTAIIPLYN